VKVQALDAKRTSYHTTVSLGLTPVDDEDRALLKELHDLGVLDTFTSDTGVPEHAIIALHKGIGKNAGPQCRCIKN